MGLTRFFLGFWNLENLFDTENSPRLEKIQKAVQNDIRGWDAALLEKKLTNLSLVIRSMNDAKGPDILGVSEVESRPVLEKLVAKILSDGGRKYSIVHSEMEDNRGIDVAFLYDETVAKRGDVFQHWVVKRSATRDLLQTTFEIAGKKIIVICNHWPSRSGGQYESEPYRIVAGETLAYWVERIHEELGDNIGIIAIGDFNDDPFSRSLTEYALSTNSRERVLSGRLKYLYNTCWEILGNETGTLFYSGSWNCFDQILINRALLDGKSGWTIDGKASVQAREIMGKTPEKIPHRFGIKPNERDTRGFSDHFPVGVTIREFT